MKSYPTSSIRDPVIGRAVPATTQQSAISSFAHVIPGRRQPTSSMVSSARPARVMAGAWPGQPCLCLLPGSYRVQSGSETATMSWRIRGASPPAGWTAFSGPLALAGIGSAGALTTSLSVGGKLAGTGVDLGIQRLIRCSAKDVLEPVVTAPRRGAGASSLTFCQPFKRIIVLRDQSYRTTPMQTIQVQAGATIFSSGDPSLAVYVIADGEVAITVDDAAGGERVARLGAGELFGESGVLEGRRRAATATAVTATTLLVTEAEAFFHAFGMTDERALALVKLLCRRLRETSRRAVRSNPSRAPRAIPLRAIETNKSHVSKSD